MATFASSPSLRMCLAISARCSPLIGGTPTQIAFGLSA
jgi:hypothetical protein